MLLAFILGGTVGFFIRHFGSALLVAAKRTENEVNKALKGE